MTYIRQFYLYCQTKMHFGNHFLVYNFYQILSLYVYLVCKHIMYVSWFFFLLLQLGLVGTIYFKNVLYLFIYQFAKETKQENSLNEEIIYTHKHIKQ